MVRAEFKPSFQLAVLIAFSHAGAAALTLTVDLSDHLRIGLFAFIAASCARGLYGPALLRARNSIVGAILGDEAVSIRRRGGTWHAAALQDSSFVASYLTILNVRVTGCYFTRHIVILSDRLDPETFRQLRVWLRWRKPGNT